MALETLYRVIEGNVVIVSIDTGKLHYTGGVDYIPVHLLHRSVKLVQPSFQKLYIYIQ